MVKRKIMSMLMVIVTGILMIFSSVTVFAAESDIPDATDQFYVNDFANIIDDETEREMVERAKAYSDSSDGVQVVVTTVQTIGNADPVKYTTKMYNKYGIGKNNMGILIMLSVETRDIQMREGDNIRKYINASTCGNIVDKYGKDYLADNNFEEGLYQIQKATIEYLEGKSLSAENEVVIAPAISDGEKNNNVGKIAGTILLILLVIVGLVGVVYGIKIYSKARKEKKEAEEIERIENSELVQKKNQIIKSLENELINEKERLNEIISLRERKIEFLNNQVSSLQDDFEQLQKRYVRARIAYPDVDKKVDAIFAKEKEEADKAKALKVTNSIKSVIVLDSGRIHLSRFKTALNEFENLTSEQKKYVSSELVRKLENSYKESLRQQREYEESERIRKNKEKAAEVQNLILAALAMHVTRHSLRDLSDICNAYNNLSNEQRKYVTADIEALKNMQRRARRMQDDYEEEERRREEEERRRRREREEEERRRRAASSYSSSSFGGSSFGGSSGFGGHSSGHGAGRKF